MQPHVAVGGCVAMATSVGLGASAAEATGNSGSLSDDVLDVGVGWGVSVSRQMRQTSRLLVGVVVKGGDDAGVNVRVEAGGGSNAKSSASGGGAAAVAIEDGVFTGQGCARATVPICL